MSAGRLPRLEKRREEALTRHRGADGKQGQASKIRILNFVSLH